ncbi:helix-turn-helix transcriptional regulator [Limosilactobacillus sp. RRLNB_1_1]|uniref:Helix-turn-helix transcriptional regulator n=1 Tax=Limosilactobacillus albertensis TaxID=2759752 RepID=A0A7W3TRJ5_9LACO|nr:helix-turn-helix transcriptional regulator [Limosilactobacillus albertensis]MBB1069590.1 helix-turn-helix transcriptional regulator [Limosilactobacillus albertensis]MCD7118117.1 helix-turn-helix domain-containing protein [Limosilactobacillus albertensis]MCD7127629.1 helix-turn-helix domain-containing protein [Limosilactobacillus albertensis]
MKFADKMKLYRHQHNWTQQEVAERLAISRKTISSWENSRSYPDIFMLVQISDLYHVSLDNLLREDHEMMDNYKEEHRTNVHKQQLLNILYFINIAGCIYFLLQSNGIVYISVESEKWQIINNILLGLFSINIIYLISQSKWELMSWKRKIKILITLLIFSILLMKLDSLVFHIGKNDLQDFATGFMVAMKSFAFTGLIWLFPQFKERRAK